jgi:hypothetical protein
MSLAQFDGPHERRVDWYWLAIALALAIGFVYLPLAQYGYVQDDWSLISYLSRPAPVVIQDILIPHDLFYRPLGLLYAWGVYSVFGSFAGGFHLLSLLMLFGTSLVVVRIGQELTRDRLAGWAAGFLYATYAWIHLDPQMWLVGIFDNGSVLFALLSVFLFLRKRWLWSAVCYGLALGFKESVVLLPVVLVVAGLPLNWRELWRHAVVFGAWAALKSMCLLPSDTYAIGFGVHIFVNFWTYLVWIGPILIPAILAYKKPIYAVWVLVGLVLPSLFLAHSFRYYCAFSLAGACIAGAYGLSLTRYKRWIFALVIVAQFLLARGWIRGHVERGANDDIPAQTDGYNHLLRKALRGQ